MHDIFHFVATEFHVRGEKKTQHLQYENHLVILCR